MDRALDPKSPFRNLNYRNAKTSADSESLRMLSSESPGTAGTGMLRGESPGESLALELLRQSCSDPCGRAVGGFLHPLGNYTW